jgi:putative transposase
VSDHQARYPIATMCRLLGVSSSGYYAWVQRPRSRRAETDETLIGEIRAAHGASRGIYGAPRVHAELTAKGIQVGRKRVARLMSRAGLAGVCRRKFVVTTVKGDNRQAPDLVERNFAAEAPDRLWVADITYIPTWAGFLYLAVVLDAYSCRIVGWSTATAAVTPACAPRWVRSVTHTTMPCARASSPRSSASFLLAAGSRHRPRRAMRRLPSSKASTIARHNAHLAMLLKRTDFVGPRPVMRGVLGGSWPAGRGRGRQCCRDQHG